MIPAFLRLGPSPDGSDHGSELVTMSASPHPREIGPVLLRPSIQSCVMAAMVADLVEHGPAKKIPCSNGSWSTVLPVVLVHEVLIAPRQPVAALSVSGKQQHLSAWGELKREHEASIVGLVVHVERDLTSRCQPVVIDTAERSVGKNLILAALLSQGDLNLARR